MVDRHEAVYPPKLKKEELAAVAERRDQAWGQPVPGQDRRQTVAGNGMPPDAVGLALSGGGIRSATFSLGVLQALARSGLLRYVDFLSTVSGGGCAGGFLGALVSRDRQGDTPGIAFAEQQLADSQSPPMRWLRKNGRYLAPNGIGDAVMAASVYVRNLVALQVVILAALIALVFAAAVLGTRADAAVPDLVHPKALWPTAYWFLALLALLVITVPLGAAYWLVRRLESAWSVAQSLATIIGVAALTALPFLLSPWRQPQRAVPRRGCRRADVDLADRVGGGASVA